MDAIVRSMLKTLHMRAHEPTVISWWKTGDLGKVIAIALTLIVFVAIAHARWKRKSDET